MTMSEMGRIILNQDGLVRYFDDVINNNDATYYLNYFVDNIEWTHDKVFLFGKHHTTKRKVAWYADSAIEYTYSNTKKVVLPWTEGLLRLKKTIEKKTAYSYNSCLLNLYHNGGEGMGWHSDNESKLKKNGAIASVSFGAVRKFHFKHKKTKDKISIDLQPGSLLLMEKETQQYWHHQLPISKKIKNLRVNLTFRTIDE